MFGGPVAEVITKRLNDIRSIDNINYKNNFHPRICDMYTYVGRYLICHDIVSKSLLLAFEANIL